MTAGKTASVCQSLWFVAVPCTPAPIFLPPVTNGGTLSMGPHAWHDQVGVVLPSSQAKQVSVFDLTLLRSELLSN